MLRFAPRLILITPFLFSACSAFSDAQLKGDVTNANGIGDDTVTGGGINVQKNSGAFGTSGGVQLNYSAAATQTDTLTNAPGITKATLNVTFDLSGPLQVKTYQNTDNGICAAVTFSYLQNGTGWHYNTSNGADPACGTPSGPGGTYTVDITDASAPHGNITTTMAQDVPSCGNSPACTPNCPPCGPDSNLTFAF